MVLVKSLGTSDVPLVFLGVNWVSGYVLVGLLLQNLGGGLAVQEQLTDFVDLVLGDLRLSECLGKHERRRYHLNDVTKRCFCADCCQVC